MLIGYPGSGKHEIYRHLSGTNDDAVRTMGVDFITKNFRFGDRSFDFQIVCFLFLCSFERILKEFFLKSFRKPQQKCVIPQLFFCNKKVKEINNKYNSGIQLEMNE